MFIRSRFGKLRGHPLATPSIGTNEFLRFVPHPVSTLPGRRRPRALVLVVWLRDSAHQSPIRIKAGTVCCACPWLHWQPQKTLCSPSRPIVASKRARTDLWFRHVLSQAIQPLVARDTGAASPCSGGASGGDAIRSPGYANPGGTATTAPLLLIRTLAPRRRAHRS